MNLQEGQIYEGNVSITGEAGSPHKWIVVSPFGKTHIHSIDNPMDAHYWPAMLIEQGLDKGLVKLIEKDPAHPCLTLQRDKELMDIHDLHLGLNEKNLDRMLDLLQLAVSNRMETAPYVAGEILSSLRCSSFDSQQNLEIKQQVEELMNSWQATQPPSSSNLA